MPQLHYPIDNREAYQSRIRFTVKTADPFTDQVLELLETPEPPAGIDTNNPNEMQAFEDKAKQRKAEQASQLGPKYIEDVEKFDVVSLFVPVSIQFNDGVAYNNIDLGILGADTMRALAGGSSLAAAGMNAVADASTSLFDIVKSGINFGEEAGQVAAARLLPGKAGTIAKIAGQATTNPNTRTLFNNVNLRQFNFTFKMIPTSRQESIAIEGIIKHFRREMYPELIALNAGYRFPNAFGIQVKHKESDVKFQRIPDCFLMGVDTVYNGQSAVFHADGYPSEVDMTLKFTEMRPMHKGRVEEGF